MTMQDSFLDRLAQRLGGTANAATIFGVPVERGDVTVIPVAKAAYGFGGGSGTRSGEEGSGAGGGVRVAPVGYIEILTRRRRLHADSRLGTHDSSARRDRRADAGGWMGNRQTASAVNGSARFEWDRSLP